MADLAKIFKAYDVRGAVPEELDEGVAEAVGAAFVRLTGAGRVVTAHDMRASSAPLATAFARGATSQGADVVAAGLGSTDMLYYASGSLDIPGAMFTASHNPARYNGIKLCRSGAKPVGESSGLREIRTMVEQGVAGDHRRPGTLTERDLLSGYAGHLKTLVDLSAIRPLRVVVDAGNGMAGLTVPKVFDGLPLHLTPMFFELDGSFPNHEANPIEPENVRQLRERVAAEGADLGLAFDGDADRCFVIDEQGGIVSPSAITALIATRELDREPNAAVVHNLITSRAVAEIITEHGGTPVRTRVGHSFIKTTMAERHAVFGGEHSGHFYFRDFWYADSGMLAALHVIAALGTQRRPLSELLADYIRYVASGEINSTVTDQNAAIAAVRDRYTGSQGVTLDELDGLTVSADDWWFNLRPSNTEPLLRLNVEAVDEPTMAARRDDVLATIGAYRGRQSERRT